MTDRNPDNPPLLLPNLAAFIRRAWLPLTVLVVAMAALSIAVRRRSGPVDVTGHYRLNQGHARDELDLRPDGAYVHSYILPGQPPEIDSGRWHSEVMDGAFTLTFDDFVMKSSLERDRRPDVSRGFWGATPERTMLGKLKLPVDPDKGWSYIRDDRTRVTR